MLRLLADENFNDSIVRGLLWRRPETDVVRVQDVGLSGANDRLVLAWAAHEGRVLLTPDQKTIPTYAYERVMAGLPMPGVFRRLVVDADGFEGDGCCDTAPSTTSLTDFIPGRQLTPRVRHCWRPLV
jgi:Domain of unknown function (DUF5615)